MKFPSIYWQEGMFMWPHHMQQEIRQQEERGRLNHQWDVHHNWGLRTLELDDNALRTGRLVVRRLRARMRDGTLVDIPADGPPPLLDLIDAVDGNDDATIVLTAPQLRDHRANAAEAGPSVEGEETEARYQIDEAEVRDENNGESPQMIRFRSIHFKLSDERRDLTGYETLRILRVRKVPGADAEFQIDPDYIPPLLTCDAWNVLTVDILQKLFHHISALMDSYAGQVLSRGVGFETQNPGDAMLLGQLGFLNEAHSVLNTLAFVPGIHPFPIYLELCRMLGQLAVFTPERRAQPLPPYDHDDLGGCFYRVARLLEGIRPPAVEYVQRPFVGAKLRMQVALEAKWLQPSWKIFVGVHSSIPRDAVLRLLGCRVDSTPAGDEALRQFGGTLDMKIGSSDRVDELFERSMRGLEFTPVSSPPRALPVRADLTYFQVNRDSQKEEWARVLKAAETATPTLAIRLNKNLVDLNADGTIDGQREVILRKSLGGQRATMQFSLYLVPDPS